MNDYLTDQEMASIVEAIKTAENHSLGEIRVHIDAHAEDGESAKRAYKVFQDLEMNKTQHRTGVLFHVNFEQKYLTIIGDTAIHQKVTQVFWDKIHDEMTAAFAQGKYCEGIINAVLEAGIEFKKYFPIAGENPNELSDEITFS